MTISPIDRLAVCTFLVCLCSVCPEESGRGNARAEGPIPQLKTSPAPCRLLAREPARTLAAIWLDRLGAAGSRIAIEAPAPGELFEQLEPDGRTAIMSAEDLPQPAPPATARRGIRDVKSFRLAFDGIVFFVNRENDVAAASLSSLDAIYSAERRRGAAAAPASWGDLGQKGKWKRRSIHPFEAADDRASNEVVHRDVLGGARRLSAGVRIVPSTVSVVQAVSDDVSAIGFGSLASTHSGVRVVPLKLDDTSQPVDPTPESILRGAYPFVSVLRLSLHTSGTGASSCGFPALLSFIGTEDGQDIAWRDGYIPLPESLLAVERSEIARSWPPAKAPLPVRAR